MGRNKTGGGLPGGGAGSYDTGRLGDQPRSLGVNPDPSQHAGLGLFQEGFFQHRSPRLSPSRSK